jgi:hypothetical protein
MVQRPAVLVTVAVPMAGARAFPIVVAVARPRPPRTRVPLRALRPRVVVRGWLKNRWEPRYRPLHDRRGHRGRNHDGRRTLQRGRRHQSVRMHRHVARALIQGRLDIDRHRDGPVPSVPLRRLRSASCPLVGTACGVPARRRGPKRCRRRPGTHRCGQGGRPASRPSCRRDLVSRPGRRSDPGSMRHGECGQRYESRRLGMVSLGIAGTQQSAAEVRVAVNGDPRGPGAAQRIGNS